MLQICNARLHDRVGLHTVSIDEAGRLRTIEQTTVVPPDAWDLNGGFLGPGLVDLQLNGALGVEFSELEGDEGLARLAEISRFLWSTGVSGWLATLISVPVEKLHAAMATIARFEAPADGARLLGVHLEGPFLNPEFEGAHLRHCLLMPTVENARRLVGDYADLVRLVTLAPELDPAGETIPWLVERGILVSLGHTAATYDEARAAFDRGATLVTHVFNAQRPLHHREPGVIGAALLDERVHCLCIPDRVHLHPATMRLLVRLKGATNLTAVSDAVAPLGVGDGVYEWHGMPIRVEAGRVQLPDGRLAGSALGLAEVTGRLAEQFDGDQELALELAALNPRRLLGLPEFPAVGERADLIAWPSDSPTPVRAVAGGQRAVVVG